MPNFIPTGNGPLSLAVSMTKVVHKLGWRGGGRYATVPVQSGAGIHQRQRREEKVRLRLVLVCRPSPAREKYQQALADLGVTVDTVADVNELAEQLIRTPCSGLLIDTATGLVTSFEKKRQLHVIIEIFPVLRVNWNDQAQQLELFYYGQSQPTDLTLRQFIETQCLPFEARTIRAHERYRVHFNVEVYPDEQCRPEQRRLSVTLDLSEGGAFLVMIEPWSGPREIWLKIVELADQTPIRSEVRRQVNWGNSKRIPGIGVAFRQIAIDQVWELQARLSSGRDRRLSGS